MRKTTGLMIATVLLCAVATHADVDDRGPDESVAATMLTMRAAGAVIEAYRQDTGTFPGADGDLRPLKEVLRSEPAFYRKALKDKDAWGQSLRYRANDRYYQIISFGEDRTAGQDYDAVRIIPSRAEVIVNAEDSTWDLVLADGRFVQRPFDGMDEAFATINSMNRIFTAAASYAVDSNRYPGTSMNYVPVSELVPDLVPLYIHELPLEDGWGRSLLYLNNGKNFVLASFGADGQQDRSYSFDLPCGVVSFYTDPSPEPDTDIVQANGVFFRWPLGVEP